MGGLNIGIAGAGLLGRLAAWTLSRQGHRVTVFDPAHGPRPTHDGHGAAGFTAAGMLSPLAERESTGPRWTAHGWHGIARWSAISRELGRRHGPAPAFAQKGSLLVAHGSDLGTARRVLARLDDTGAHGEREAGSAPGQGLDDGAPLGPGHPSGAPARAPAALSPAQLADLEPALHGATGPLHAWLLAGEAHLDTVRMMQCLHDDARGVQWRWGTVAGSLAPHRLATALGSRRPHELFDWVIDARGLGARPDCPVRGVRGEIVWLHAPGLGLQRPVRLLHPRHRVYIVPRPGDVVLVGATEIESEDRSPMSLRSAVELMAAAHSVLPGLAEARILRLDVNLRPALPDHEPMVHVEPGLVRINGLYRHGWLLGPAMLDEAMARMGLPAPESPPLPTPLQATTPLQPARHLMTHRTSVLTPPDDHALRGRA